MQYLIGIFIGIAIAGLLMSATMTVFKLGRAEACAHPEVCEEQAP